MSLYGAIVDEVAKEHLNGPYSKEMVARFVAALHARVVKKLGPDWSAHLVQTTKGADEVRLQVDIRLTEKCGVTSHFVIVGCRIR